MKIKAVERELIEPGWQKAYKSPREKDTVAHTGKGILAALEIGQRVRPKKVRAQKQSGLDEAGLIRALREKGIGRPATYALIVEALLGRKYVERGENGHLQLTQRGREVCEFLVERFIDLFNLAYTARMEADLDEVGRGKMSYEAAVGSIWEILKGK